MKTLHWNVCSVFLLKKLIHSNSDILLRWINFDSSVINSKQSTINL